MKEEKRLQHSSFGSISFSRVSSSESTPLFGSSIRSRHTIILSISEADMCRLLNSDHIHTGRKIVEVEMSESQFAQLITSLNHGDGTPCTLRFRSDKGGFVEPCEYVDKREEFEMEFKETQAESKQHYADFENMVKEIMEKKTIGKGDREEIIKQMDILRSRLFANQEFVYKQFNEQMDKTVKEAKGEIEAFMQTRLMAAAGIDVSKDSESTKEIEGIVEI